MAVIGKILLKRRYSVERFTVIRLLDINQLNFPRQQRTTLDEIACRFVKAYKILVPKYNKTLFALMQRLKLVQTS